MIGSLLGFTSWAFVLGILFATTGDAAAFWRVVPITLFASVGLWTLAISGHDAARHRFGPRSAEATLALLGGIAIGIGMLAALVDLLVMPEIARHPDILRTLESTGSALTISPWIPPGAIALGAVLAWIPLWRSPKPR